MINKHRYYTNKSYRLKSVEKCDHFTFISFELYFLNYNISIHDKMYIVLPTTVRIVLYFNHNRLLSKNLQI